MKETKEVHDLAVKIIESLPNEAVLTPTGVVALCFAYVSLCKSLNIPEDMQDYLVKTARESMHI